MRPSANSFKEQIASGKKLINGWCSIPCTLTAEAMSQAGFDSLVVDIQHGLQDYQTAVSMIQAMGKDVPILCRVHWNEPGIVMKMLDAGFTGVICPMINTKEDAESFAGACRYPPRGFRSFGPTRAQVAFGTNYARTVNDWVTTLPMIETVEAVQNLDEILAVEGIDGVYIGPADLSLSMGYEASVLPCKEVLDVIENIRKACAAAGKIAGVHCGSPEMVQRMHRQGFQMATLLTDMSYFVSSMTKFLGEARNAAPTLPPGSLY
jgi:4-hydroxy-2-oxoheptanedioate aldolase